MGVAVGVEVIFLGVFGLVLLNLASAGVAGWLAIKARLVTRARRAAWAIVVTGALVALMFLGFALTDISNEAWASTAAMAMLFAGGAVLSLPGAIVMSRLAERGTVVGDTFA